MIRNPFASRKSRVDQALDAFDDVRAEAADYAAGIRDVAADVAETLTEIGPSAPKRKLPILLAAAAAGLGLAYAVRSRVGGSAPGPAPEVPGPPAAATETAARTNPDTVIVGPTTKNIDAEVTLPQKPKAVVVNALHDVLAR